MQRILIWVTVVLLTAFHLSCSKDNLPPVSIFSVSPHQGDSLTVFYFDARETYDPESPDFGIQIRWDWNGDSVWDTEFSQEKEHAMRFNSQGERVIIMEATDPNGVTSIFRDTILLYSANPFVDSLIDPRDGLVYKTAKINGYWMMTENLRYGIHLPDSVWQANNDQGEFYSFNNDVQKLNYGGLYTWDEAMDYKYKAGVQGLCPPGWHIPEISEWNEALKIFPDKGIDLLYYLGPQSPSGFNLEFFGMMSFVNPGDSTVGYYYDGSNVAYWCSDRPIKILQNPDENINRTVFRRNSWNIVYHLYRRADHSIQDPLYTYASYVRCFKNNI